MIMKATTINTSSVISFQPGKQQMMPKGKAQPKPLSLKEFIVPTPISEQEIAPPAHVWDRIANVLDQLDREKGRMNTDTLLKITRERKPGKTLIAAMAVTLVAGLVWLIS